MSWMAPTLSCSLLSCNTHICSSSGKWTQIPILCEKIWLTVLLGMDIYLFIISILHPQGRYIIPAVTVSPVCRWRTCVPFCAVVSCYSTTVKREDFLMSNLNAPCCCSGKVLPMLIYKDGGNRLFPSSLQQLVMFSLLLCFPYFRLNNPNYFNTCHTLHHWRFSLEIVQEKTTGKKHIIVSLTKLSPCFPKWWAEQRITLCILQIVPVFL